ncbi:hypothetical protein [Streptomyces sp. Act143]|nr:hypothetical protein [Streptomyces sp. Act143]
MHPDEAILSGGGGRMPQAGDWKIFAIVAVLLLVGLVSKVL